MVNKQNNFILCHSFDEMILSEGVLQLLIVRLFPHLNNFEARASNYRDVCKRPSCTI